MKVIKRSGAEVEFDINKIKSAIVRANAQTETEGQVTEEVIDKMVENIESKIIKQKRALNVEEIQDLVENELMKKNAYALARHYITYRYERALARRQNTTDAKILSLVECENEEIKQENSNKNPTIVSTQRDYMAGEVSKDISERFLLPKDIVEAHKNGIIHFHDMDYFAQHIHNCDLINLEDMLQNGTVISGTKIDKPHSFLTACNIATQIVAQVASSQYGGQTFTLTHLAPFVDITRQKIREDVISEMEELISNDLSNCLANGFEFYYKDIIKPTYVTQENYKELLNKTIDVITEKRVLDEIQHGVQTIQYQINTLQTTNGFFESYGR